MNQNILKFLKSYSYDTKDVNRLLVSSFLVVNNINNVSNRFIEKFIISEEEEFNQVEEFIKLLDKNTFDIEELIELFEFVISPQDKEVNGAVFTPEYIRKYIVKSVIEKQNSELLLNLKFGDIACGCGGFFKTITEYYRDNTEKSFYEIYRDNIYGLDIQEYSILRTKILLSLLAIINNEDCEVFEFNLYCGNALSFDWSEIKVLNKNNGFDVVVGNPPYVGASKMDEETKELLINWSVSKTGKPDLYIPFFEIGMENLNENGVLGYITVNTFYKSLNGRSLRSYFSKNKFDISIIDFGGEQLFKKRSTYTCICIIGKTESTSVKYLKRKSSEIQRIKNISYISIPYNNLDDFNGWYLLNKKVQKIISKIENCGIPIGDKFEIRNGFATLLNKEILALRDKGNKQYDQWFSFGRNQALTLSGFKLLFPYITNKPCFVLTEDTDLLFYNGYAVLSESTEELLILQKILMSKVFWYYIENTSKPYAGNYFSVAKNYIKSFGICDLSERESKILLNLTKQDEIDLFLMDKYQVKL